MSLISLVEEDACHGRRAATLTSSGLTADLDRYLDAKLWGIAAVLECCPNEVHGDRLGDLPSRVGPLGAGTGTPLGRPWDYLRAAPQPVGTS